MPDTQTVQHVDARLSALETRVEGIVGTLQSVASAVGGLGEKMDKRSQPQWSIYISAFGLMFTALAFIGTAWKSPIETSLANVATDVHRMQSDYVPRWVHEREWGRDAKERDRLELRLDRIEAGRPKS